jgi:hypothetical protein
MRRLTLLRCSWFPGPAVVGRTGQRYRADLALPLQRIAIEVNSHGELRKLTLDRLLAFSAAGWRLRVIHHPREVDGLVRGDIR